MNFEKALEIASRLTLPIPVVAFAIVFAAFAYAVALRAKKRSAASLLLAVLIAFVVLGLAPLAASTYLESRGVYRIQVVVRGIDNRPIRDAEITASVGAPIKKGEGYWEIEVPYQTRPTDHHIKIFASNGVGEGESVVSLENGYYIQTTIKLAPLPSASIRGIVKDDRGKGVPNAHVSIPGYTDGTTTDQWGNFELLAHAGEGQMITVRAQTDDLAGEITVPAGAEAEITLKKR